MMEQGILASVINSEELLASVLRRTAWAGPPPLAIGPQPPAASGPVICYFPFGFRSRRVLTYYIQYIKSELISLIIYLIF